ncbi:MAG TPA: hypothetical protein VJB14_17325 [Planctomycetota bacterium]|nr:hypothetical protein [Planctomycetota bacterium]
MLRIVALALLIPLFAGCLVVHDHNRPHSSPPPPSTTVTVSHGYGWNHVRYVVWREYYSCDDEEVYYLENCGYDDDDLLVMCFIARRARVPVRHVVFEYDRCGRSLFNLAMVFRIDPFLFYSHEVPRGYACPPGYARAYGYYWAGDRHYLANSECHALLHLQIGIRYYGYSHAVYFQERERCVQRADPHPFRAIAVRDYSKAGAGAKTCDDRVVVKKDRPWEARDVKEWDKRREQDRQRIQVVVKAKEPEENEKARRAAESDDRRRAHEETRTQVQVLKEKRAQDDRVHAEKERAKPPPATAKPVQPPPNPKPVERKPDPPPAPRREPAPPPAPPRKPDPPPPPPKKAEDPPKKRDDPPKKGGEEPKKGGGSEGKGKKKD